MNTDKFHLFWGEPKSHYQGEVIPSFGGHPLWFGGDPGESNEKSWDFTIWIWINTYENTIFSGMNIHLPAILMWTEGVQGFDTLPYHQERNDFEKNSSGWWFRTWILFFPSCWEFHHPNWRTHMFQRGRYTNQSWDDEYQSDHMWYQLTSTIQASFLQCKKVNPNGPTRSCLRVMCAGLWTDMN